MKLALAIIGFVALIAATAPLEKVDAHVRADVVLVPRFVAAFNDYTVGHGSAASDSGHYKKFDAGDAKRWRAARDAWKDLDESMKQAGY